MSRVRPWLGLALIGASACSVLVDLSGLANHDDAGASDATPPLDVVSDVVVVPDAADAAATTCEGAELVSDDFDTAPLGSLWNAVSGSGAAISIDSTDNVTAPSSLLVTVPVEGGTAALRKGMSAKHVCCEYDVKLDAINGRTFKLSGEQGNYSIELTTSNTATQVLEDYYTGTDAGIIRFLSINLPPNSAWRHLVIDAQFPIGSGAGMISVKVDGKPTLQDTLGAPAFDLAFENVYVGVTYAATAQGMPRSVHFDNFRCTTQ
jgi:hypothetical protein